MGSMALTNSSDPERVLENRRRFAAAAGVPSESITVVGAVHGAEVARIDAPAALVAGVDGLVTDSPDVSLFATFADCYPLVIFDPDLHALALGHAGWRGTKGGMAGQLVAALAREYGSDPAGMLAVVGPGICGECYEVGPEFAERFGASLLMAGRGDRLLLDLREANRLQLVAAGIPSDRITVVDTCTLESEEFFSHRRKPDGSRFATLAFFR